MHARLSYSCPDPIHYYVIRSRSHISSGLAVSFDTIYSSLATTNSTVLLLLLLSSSWSYTSCGRRSICSKSPPGEIFITELLLLQFFSLALWFRFPLRKWAERCDWPGREHWKNYNFIWLRIWCRCIIAPSHGTDRGLNPRMRIFIWFLGCLSSIFVSEILLWIILILSRMSGWIQ